MPRVKRSVHARKKRRKVLEQAKGYWGLKSRSYRYAKEQVEHSLAYAYRDRKAASGRSGGSGSSASTRPRARNGLSYNQFIAGCTRPEIELDRKVLADLAVATRPRSARSPSRRRPRSSTWRSTAAWRRVAAWLP